MPHDTNCQIYKRDNSQHPKKCLIVQGFDSRKRKLSCTMSIIFTALCLTTLANPLVALRSDLLVRTPLGRLGGFYLNASYGRTYRAFEGIPYGKAPINDLRFEPPQRYGAWDGILSANKAASKCLQYTIFPTSANRYESVVGSEDCLYLNVYTPRPKRNRPALLPVLFWIHGGAFQLGSGHSEGSSYILNRDIVYVNFNYRLGILGFMSTEDEVVPGNMGLKDQSLALRWVHENIRFFGGDPNRITVGGSSAGGASAHYHMLSSRSRGLFQGAISISGTALDCWAQVENSAEKSKQVASSLGCPTSTTQDMMKCLKLLPERGIMQLYAQTEPWVFNPFTTFGPVVETNSTEPFIDRSPVEIITSGDVADVPWLMSDTSEEGLYPAAKFINNPTLMAQLDEHWEIIAPHLLDFNFTVPRDKHGDVARAIRRHYLGSARIEKGTALRLIHMIGDRLYTADGQRAAKLMAAANRSPVWFYYYNYRGPFSVANVFGMTENFGVSHGDDAVLIVTYAGIPVILDKPTLDMQHVLLNIVESFVTNGIPSTEIHWPKVNSSTEGFEYLQILGPGQLTAVCNTNFAERKFWSSIDFQENKFDK